MRRHARVLFATAALLAAFFAFAGEAPAADNCPNAAVRAQQGAQALPDCRAYEMVSPEDKGNGDVALLSANWSTPSGDGLYFESTTAFPGSEGVSQSAQYIAWRSATGWSTEALNPYQTPDTATAFQPNEGYLDFSEDLTRGIVLTQHDPNDRSSDVSNDQKNLYLHTKGGGFAPVTPPAAVVPPFFVYGGPALVGSSNDKRRIFFQSDRSLTADAPPEGVNEAYEWHDGTVSVVGVLPDEEVAPQGAVVGQGTGGKKGQLLTHSAVSPDGTQVVFKSGSPAQLYIRSAGKTKLISASQREGEEGTPATHGATFMGSSSADGGAISVVYFLSPDLLTEDASGDPAAASANELYAYDVGSGKLTLISVVSNPGVHGARAYPNWISPSADGRYVYFIASSALVPGAPENLEGLYVWHDGTIRYLLRPPANIEGDTWPSRISADGSRLLLRATADTKTPIAGGPFGMPEIYLYDYPSNGWACLSCNPDGPTTRPADFDDDGASGFHGFGNRQHESRNLSPDGSTAYFETAEPLLPRDTNGLTDVYEWHQGQLLLISPGQGDMASHFLEATPDGSTVFIATRARLAPQDQDNFIDAYAARVDGGFLYQPPPSPCSGDDCQASPAGAVAWSSPSSAQVATGGNARQARKARCVPRKAKVRAKSKAHRRGKAKAHGKARRGKRARAGAAKPRCGKPRQAGQRKAGANRKHAGGRGRGGRR